MIPEMGCPYNLHVLCGSCSHFPLRDVFLLSYQHLFSVLLFVPCLLLLLLLLFNEAPVEGRHSFERKSFSAAWIACLRLPLPAPAFKKVSFCGS